MNAEHRTSNVDKLVKSIVTDGFVKCLRSRLAAAIASFSEQTTIDYHPYGEQLCSIPRNEACIHYAAVTGDEAKCRYRTLSGTVFIIGSHKRHGPV